MAPKHFAPVWKHFSRNLPVGRSKHHRAQCLYCKYELSGQPERMKAHLRKCKKISYKIRNSILKEYQGNDQSDPDSADDRSEPININSYPTKNFDIENNSHYPESTSNTQNNYEDKMTLSPLNSPRIGHNQTFINNQRPRPENSYRHHESLPGSVQGLLGLSWDRTGRSILNIPQSDQTYSYHTPSYLKQTKHQPHENRPDIPLQKTHFPLKNHNRAEDELQQSIKSYYSKLPSAVRKQTSITNKIAPHPIIKEAIHNVPAPVRDRYFGCGIPIPMGIEGLRVLDLGCGSGRDCYVVSKLVGQTGKVTGIDMIDEVIDIAQQNIAQYTNILGYRPHLSFIKGYNEFLYDAGLYSESFDLCISNNAINLSPNKELVFKSVFDILREGGEFYFSDIYADRRLPNHLRSHPTLVTENLGGALYIEDFKRLCQRVGFVDPRQVGPAAPVRIESPALRDLVRATQFYSITYRMFKHTRPTTVLEHTREDYGQIAIYRGTVEGQRARFRLDNDWCFEANRAVLVDGNTAVILSESWLQRHFEVQGDRSNHFGSFTPTVAPNSQYDAWELENDEYSFYNSLITDGINSGVSNSSRIGSGRMQSTAHSNSFNNINSSFNINTHINGNDIGTIKNSSNDINSNINGNATANSGRLLGTNLLNLLPASDPTPTFSISAHNFAQNPTSSHQITPEFGMISSTAGIKTNSKGRESQNVLAPITNFLSDYSHIGALGTPNNSNEHGGNSNSLMISTEDNAFLNMGENYDTINDRASFKADDNTNTNINNQKSAQPTTRTRSTHKGSPHRNQNENRSLDLDLDLDLDGDIDLGLDLDHRRRLSSTRRSAISSDYSAQTDPTADKTDKLRTNSSTPAISKPHTHPSSLSYTKKNNNTPQQQQQLTSIDQQQSRQFGFPSPTAKNTLLESANLSKYSMPSMEYPAFAIQHNKLAIDKK